jgi:hypothetical protein
MKQTMWKHRRSVRTGSLGVEGLEDRFLLSGGGSLSKGFSLRVPAVQVWSEPEAPGSVEDEPPLSAASSASHGSGDPSDASDLAATRAAMASGARSATAGDPGTPGGLIVVVLTGSDVGTTVVSSTASASAALVATPGMHQQSLSAAGSLGGVRPSGFLRADEAVVERPELGLRSSTRAHPSGPSTRDRRAAAVLPASPTAGSEAIAPPRGCGLISETLPFVRTSLEQGLARFLTRIEALGAGRSGWQDSPARWVPWFILTITAGMAPIALKRSWRAEDGDSVDERILGGRVGRHGLPGLPSSR